MQCIASCGKGRAIQQPICVRSNWDSGMSRNGPIPIPALSLSDKQADARSNSTKENIMFKALVPLLHNRAVLITLALIEDDKIRVSIVPNQINEDENDALTNLIWITETIE